jgi:hypothetical protein
MRARLRGGNDLGGGQSAGEYGDVLPGGELYDFLIESGRRDKARSGIDAVLSRLDVQNRSRAYQDACVVLHHVRDHLKRTRTGHGYFDDGYSAASDGLNGEMRVIAGVNSDGGNNPDLLDAFRDFFWVHRSVLWALASSVSANLHRLLYFCRGELVLRSCEPDV